MRSMQRMFGSVFLGALLCVPQLSSAETLADALITAYRNSNLLDQNRAVLRAADEDVATAVSSLRPLIALNATSQFTHNELYHTNDLNSSLSLTAELTLYDFGRNRASIEAARQSVLATRQALVAVEQDVLLAAVQAYVGVRTLQDNVELRESNVRLITRELRAAQDRFDVGEITRPDVFIADARLAAAQAQLADARGALTVGRENYKLAVGVYPQNLAPMPPSPSLPKTLEDARAIALRSHPDIKQLQFQVAAADANVMRAKAEMLPDIVGQAGVTDGQGRSNSQSVGINLSQTLYSGGRLSSLYRKSLAQRDITRAQLHQSSLLVAQALGQAWSDLRVAEATIEANKRQVVSARTAYEGVSEEAKLGSRTTLDVLDSEQDLLAARTALLTSEATRYGGVYNVMAQMGLLTVDYLKLGIPTYDPEAYYNAVQNAPATSSQGRRLDRVMRSIGKK